MIREPEVRALVMAFRDPIRAHYRDAIAGGQVDRDRVLEVLNGLAIATATVIAGTGDDQTLGFFVEALQMQLAGLREDVCGDSPSRVVQ